MFPFISDILSEVQCHSSLSHRGTSREDDEVTALESSELVVEGRIADRDTRVLCHIRISMYRCELLISGIQDILDGSELVLDECLCNREEGFLRLFEEIGRLRDFIESCLSDLISGTDELAEDTLVLHNLGILIDIRTREDTRHEIIQEEVSTDTLEFLLIIDHFTDRDRIDRTIASIEIHDRRVDDAMRRIIEILSNEEARYLDDTILVEEDRAEHSTLSFDTMWGDRE